MNIYIEEGKTIIQTGVSAGQGCNKYGVKGLSYRASTNKYALALMYNGKKYHIAYFNTVEAAKSINQEAMYAIEQDVFLQWLQEYKGRKESKDGSKD